MSRSQLPVCIILDASMHLWRGPSVPSLRSSVEDRLRVKLIYGMQETIFSMAPGPMGLPQIFSSSHVDEGLPLQAVARKVVVYQGGEGCPTGAGETAAFSCSFHYDHDRMTLGLSNTCGV